MLKKMGWLEPLIGALYISLQSLFWLNFVFLIYRRIDVPLLPEGAILWLMITAWIMMLPLPKLSTLQRNIWFFATLLAGSGAGYLLFNDFATSIILIVGVSFLTLKKIVDGIGAKQFIRAFIAIMIVFSIFFLFSYIIIIKESEIYSNILFLTVSFLITIVGMLVTQLKNDDGQVSKGFYKQWGIYIGWIWLIIVFLALGSIGIFIALTLIYPLFVWLFQGLITPFVYFLTEVIIPWLKKGYDQWQGNMEEIQVAEIEQGMDEPLQLEPFKEFDSTILNIIIITILIAIVAFIAYKFYKFVRDYISGRNIDDSDQIKRESAIKIQTPKSTHQASWQDKLRGIFRPYSSREEHLIRKQYREMLKHMKKKGLWKNEAMTVQQLNQLVQGSDSTSSLYERLRYGDQELSDDEIVLYRDEIQKIINEIKK